MHRHRANEIPGPRARDQYRGFILAFGKARKHVGSCAELMQCWLDIARPFLRDQAVGRQLAWWRIELMQEFTRVRRTPKIGALARLWTPDQMATEFRYRDYHYLVQFDVQAGSRAWQGHMIVLPHSTRPSPQDRIELSAGARQHIPGLVFLSLAEEGRRKIDEMEFGPLTLSNDGP